MQPLELRISSGQFGTIMGTRPSVGILYPYNTLDDERRYSPLSTKPFRQPPHPALSH